MQNIINIVFLYIVISLIFKMLKTKKKGNYKRYKYKKKQKSKDIGFFEILHNAFFENPIEMAKKQYERTEKPRIETKQKTAKEKYREKKERGTEYEEQVGECYEDENYKVIYRGIEKGRNDGGIDLIATAGDEMLLIQCKNWKSAPNMKEITYFLDNCKNFIKENNLKNYKIRKIFACSYPRIDYGVKKFLNENRNIIEYKIIPYIEV